jgi:hypothetical protein
LVTFSVICFPEKCRPGKNKNQLKVAKSRAWSNLCILFILELDIVKVFRLDHVVFSLSTSLKRQRKRKSRCEVGKTLQACDGTKVRCECAMLTMCPRFVFSRPTIVFSKSRKSARYEYLFATSHHGFVFSGVCEIARLKKKLAQTEHQTCIKCNVFCLCLSEMFEDIISLKKKMIIWLS